MLVLSNLKHNRRSRDFISCGITSNLDNRRNSVLLDPSEMIEGSIPLRSRIKYDKIFTLEKSLVIKGLGRISPAKFAQVKKGLFSLIDF